MKSSRRSAHVIRRNCSRGRRTKIRQQLDPAGAAMQELGKVLDETKPDVIIFLGSDHVETFSVTCVPTFAIIAGSRAHRQVRGPRVQPAGSSRDGRGPAQQAGGRAQFRHRVLGGRRARTCVCRAVRIRHRQARHSGDSVLHERLRSAAADAEAVRRARARRSREIIKGRKERVAIIASGGMSHFPGTRKYLHPEFDFDRWLVAQFEAGNTDALLNMTGTAARRGRQHRNAQLGDHVRRDRPEPGRTDRVHPDVASRSLHDAVSAAAGAGRPRRRPCRSRTAASSSGTRASSSTSIRRPRRTGSTGCCSRSATAPICAAGFIDEPRCGRGRVRAATRAAEGRGGADQRRQGRPGQRARAAARRRRARIRCRR